ncbi:uncharacterized protein [Eucyclogobius newberryi]|uniref:uncharacterized protein n=1 Tax=Eucyclogobius newberryi TaxID=166745 RepID=UPI003B590F3A
MAKRRVSDDILLNASPKKKCRGLCLVDTRLQSLAPSGVSPPSLLALLGSRCRKRPFYFDDTGETDFDMAHLRKSAHGDPQTRHELNTVQQQISGNVQKPRNSTHSAHSANSKSTNKKRGRSAGEEPADTTNSKAMLEVDAKKDNEDRSFNSFLFWRPPLPELDMSLLQEPLKNDSCAEEMET